MTPQEMSDAIAEVAAIVIYWSETTDPAEWGRDDLDTAVEVWDRLDRLMTDLAILRRAHGIVLARRIDNERTAITRDGPTTIHRDLPRTERWDGHRVIAELAVELVDTDTGEVVQAVDVDVLRRVLPACGEGQTSSKWKISELRKEIQADQYREVTYGDAVIARGPLAAQVRNTRPPKESSHDESPPAHSPAEPVRPA